MRNFSHKKITYFLCLSICFLFLIVQGDSRVSAALDKDVYKNIKIFNEILDMVKRNYVEDVDSKVLIEGAINGMMKSLDPHSSYMTRDMYKELEVETRGSFGGIGIEITMKKDVLTVVSPIEDTPAYHAGIKAGDQIIKIEGKSTKDITIMEAVKKLRGPKDTKVTITIMRENMPKPKDFVITRAIIQVKSVKWKIYNGHVGYIRISAFQERTANDLKKAINEVEAKAHPIEGLVLDLRNNPGGLLHQAIEVSNVLMKSGVIVSTKGRVKGMETQAIATDDGDEPTCPIVVLVNEGTASAAEIVSGALQDNGRSLIIGTQTFGKGSVQTVIPLEDGSALKLTTAKYYTPNGRSIQADGIKPDIVVTYTKHNDTTESTENLIRERDLKGHISPDRENGSGREPLSKEQDEINRDNQLKSAIDIIRSWEIMKKSRS